MPGEQLTGHVVSPVSCHRCDHLDQMTESNPLRRFSNRADDYAKYRPSYPQAAITEIIAAAAQPGNAATLSAPSVVADIGAGTGISARLLADQGVQVIAVEPNRAMAQSAAVHAAVYWQQGQAEATGLGTSSVDLVSCFQAFHWFTPGQALPEFYRILRLHGHLALVWNDRDPSQGFNAAFENLVQHIAGDNYLNAENRRSVAAIEASPLFGPIRHSTHTYSQTLTYEALLGRCRSCSYLPKTGAAYEELMAGLKQIFHRWKSAESTVDLLYKTHVYLTPKVGEHDKGRGA